MISKLILIHYYYLTLRPYSSFASCSNNEFMVKGSKSGSCMTFSCHVLRMSFNLQEFLCLFLALPALTLLKMAHQLCYSMSLNLCLPNVSSRLSSVFVPLARWSQKRCCVFLVSSFWIRCCMILICSITDDINFEHLIKVISTKLSHRKVSYFWLLIINKYFVRSYFGMM